MSGLTRLTVIARQVKPVLSQVLSSASMNRELFATCLKVGIDKLFEKRGGKPKDLGTVEILFVEPELGYGLWNPTEHTSFFTYLQKMDDLKEYDITQARMSYDKDHHRVNVFTDDDLFSFLKMEKRGTLHVTIPKLSNIDLAVNKNSDFLGTIRQYSAKVMNFVNSQIAKTNVDESVVKKEGEVIANLTKCTELTHTGDIKQFEEVSMQSWKEFTKTLQEDQVPSKIISGLARAAMAKKTNETIYDLVYKSGRLEHAYLVRLLTMKTSDKSMQVLLFTFSLGFKSDGGADGNSTGALTPGQTLAIERFVGKASQLFWKDKLLAVKSEEDEAAFF